MKHTENSQEVFSQPVADPETFEGPRHKATVLSLADAALSIHRRDKLIAEGLIDQKTGLKNRKAFEFDIKDRLKTAQSGEFSIVFLDMDRLKRVNDTVSWDAGDKYKEVTGKAVGGTFEEMVRPYDEVYMFDGDECIVVLDHRFDEGETDFEAITERVQNDVEHAISTVPELQGVEGLGVSAGWVTFETGDTVQGMLDKAHDMVLEQKDIRYAANGGQAERIADSRL